MKDNITYDVMSWAISLQYSPTGSLVELHSYEFMAFYLVKSGVIVKGYIINACRIYEFIEMYVEEYENKILITEVYLEI